MSTMRQRQLEQAGKKTRARARQVLKGSRGEVQMARSRQKAKTHPLDDVKFASPQARELAEDKGLTWKDFARSLRTPLSIRGYTKSEVRAVAGE